MERMGPVNYRIQQVGRRKGKQMYHINLLKPWHEPLPVPSNVFGANLPPQSPPPVKMGDQLSSRQVQVLGKQSLPMTLKPSQERQVSEVSGKERSGQRSVAGTTDPTKLGLAFSLSTPPSKEEPDRAP